MKILLAISVVLAVLLAGCNQSVMEKGSIKDESMSKESVEKPSMASQAKGSILAGSEGNARYLDFNEEAYKSALAENKVIYLEFYASWCPICRSQEPQIFAAFNELENPKIVGFRVNYDTEEGLKKQYQVPYQHTRVIIKDGKQIAKASDTWSKERIMEELNKAAA